MSTKSLGTLTLDLALQTAGLEQGMDKASRTADRELRKIERQAQARAKAIEDAFKGMASAVAAPLAAAFSVSAITGYTAELVRTSKEITTLARLANTSAGEFQRLAFGANSVGVANDKLADILKDVQDKVGDFLQTGGGPLKDFFEQIAPRVGVTAEAFRNLSGPQALQLFYSTLEKGKLSQSEFVFWLEAIASDATLLQPLLRENGRAFADMGVQAQRAGGIIGDDVLAASVELSKNWDTMATQVRGVFLPVLGDIVKLMNDDVVPALNGPLIQGALKDFTEFARATVREVKDILELVERAERAYNRTFGKVKPEGSWDAPVEPEGSWGEPVLPPVVVTGTPTGGTKPKRGTTRAQKSEYEPLADAARAYAQTLQGLSRTQQDAVTSGLNLGKAQTELLNTFSSPEWLRMPETWRLAIAEQGAYAIAAEQAAESQLRLNALLAATPTAQLEAQRETMQFLVQAFEQGRISVEQFSEAAAAALGNVPEAVEASTDGLLDMTLVANDAANAMAGAFAGFFAGQETDIKSMAASFMKATAQMIAQAAILKGLKAIAPGFFADGGAFGPAGQIKAFASGGVVDRPTYFKFANGGGFQNGLMGEAGPEAIMPLKRGRDGKLGVLSVNGGGGVTVSQQFNVTVQGNGNETGQAQGDAIAKTLRQEVKSAVMEVLIDQKRPGGVLAG